MIAVQAVDGKYYIDPAFDGKNWAVENCDLFYKGRMVSWKTARRVLRPAGIRAAYADGPFADKQILADRLVEVTRYRLLLLGPIPVPEMFSVVLSDRPAGGDFEIISFGLGRS